MVSPNAPSLRAPCSSPLWVSIAWIFIFLWLKEDGKTEEVKDKSRYRRLDMKESEVEEKGRGRGRGEERKRRGKRLNFYQHDHFCTQRTQSVSLRYRKASTKSDFPFRSRGRLSNPIFSDDFVALDDTSFRWEYEQGEARLSRYRTMLITSLPSSCETSVASESS